MSGCIQRRDGNHKFVTVYSGRLRCTRCGYDHERHGVPGRGFPPDGAWPCYYVDKVYDLGTGAPDDANLKLAEELQ